MDHQGSPLTRRRTLLAGAGLAVAAAGLRPAAAAGAAAPARPATPTRPTAPTGPETRAGFGLTPQQLAGQRVIYSYPGATVPQDLLDLIAQGLAGGVIIFGQNVTSLAQITAAVQQLQEANAQSPVAAPLLVMTDQEGGLVRRLPGGPVMSQKQIGESADPPGAAAAAGTEAGRLLRGAGVNVNLAPVLDVYRTPGDFDDQFQRSYSMDPDVVAACGRAFITAQQDQRVAATAKHFPGLGPACADQNTDAGPVTLTTPLTELRGIDERPYGPAVEAGVDLVMVSWAVYPALDPDRPAGLSPRVVQDELRHRHHFHGVTVTDAINAGALTALGTPPQNAVAAARAGMDLILDATRDVSQGLALVQGLGDALANGDLDPREFRAALHRTVRLRRNLA
ncbi:glycoside hydrolase family 3 N-terminal domain-containing protein [Kitasatospora sp. LaBMicrA B282]|uniref:glycoside hydrolase family 3 N-terminal domain-containing protein n=1 Tax=Kitasatospora sp. LaBMicrA B282 TaxID=3420949 RepID=UPI003D1518C5